MSKPMELHNYKMTNSMVKEVALQNLESGKSHQETFDQIRTDTDTKLSMLSKSKIIRYIPSLEQRKKYKYVHRGLISL